MAKAVEEIAVGAAIVGASFLVPGSGIAIAGLALSHGVVAGALVSMGASMVLNGVGQALANNQGGVTMATTSPIGPWQIIYGTQKVGGIKIFEESNSSQGTSNDKQLHRVYALACHPCAIGSWQLRIDGKQVLMNASGPGYVSHSPTQYRVDIASISRTSGVVTMVLTAPITGVDGSTLLVRNVSDNTFNGTWIVSQPNPTDATTFTYVCGGADTTTSGGSATTTFADYKDKIYVEFCGGNHTSTFAGLLASGTSWGANDLCLNRTVVYVRMGYDSSVFPSSIPNVSFVIDGKNDIYDPRTGTRGFTTNPALCIADYLSLPTTSGGFGLTIGTDIPTSQLIAAANVCDETVSLAAGGTTARYTCNTSILLTQTRGRILEQMLTSCAGRISWQGGQFYIVPGAWISASLQLTAADLVGPIEWRSRLPISGTCNMVKGTYTSPENDWQMADFPPYMEDARHGFVSDPWLIEDNSERIPRDLNLPCTGSAAIAQRIAKIDLLRTRWQGRGTIRCSMKAYQAIALDVIELTYPRYTWVNKPFEILSSRLVMDSSQGTPALVVELDIAETDPGIYDWSITEQLTPQGYSQSNNVGIRVCSPPEDVTAYTGPGAVIDGITYPSTVQTGADGRIQSSIYVRWTQPNDANVVFGGHLEVQWQPYGGPSWSSLGRIDSSASYAIIPNVTDGAEYNIQVRAVNCAGVASEWVEVDPITVTDSYSSITSAGLNPNSPYNINNDAVLDSVVATSGLTANIRVYGPGGAGTAWDNFTGQGNVSYPAATLTGELFANAYYVVVDPTTTDYYAFTDYNNSLADHYIAVGSLITVASGGTGGNSGGGGGGTGGGGGGPRKPIYY